jgi:hypothetical protein
VLCWLYKLIGVVTGVRRQKLPLSIDLNSYISPQDGDRIQSPKSCVLNKDTSRIVIVILILCYCVLCSLLEILFNPAFSVAFGVILSFLVVIFDLECSMLVHVCCNVSKLHTGMWEICV